MAQMNLDWTHKGVKITDIRKLAKYYIFSINFADKSGTFVNLSPLSVKIDIFESRLKSYFLKDTCNISREEILNVSWNMYITKGHYVKVHDKGEIEKFEHDPEKWYISYLEISGLLGTFASVYREKEYYGKEALRDKI